MHFFAFLRLFKKKFQFLKFIYVINSASSRHLPHVLLTRIILFKKYGSLNYAYLKILMVRTMVVDVLLRCYVMLNKETA